MDIRPAGPEKVGGWEDTLGVWSRNVEEDPIGTLHDNTTLVVWVQTPSKWFVDIRVPANRPDSLTKAKSLNECSRDDMLWMGKQKGFAGKMDLAFHPEDQPNGYCTFTWNRDLDYQPPNGSADVGLCSFTDTSKLTLIEYGVVGDDYKEIWERQRPTSGYSVAMTLVSDSSSHSAKGVFVIFEGKFSYMIDRTNGVPAAKSWEELMQRETDENKWRQWLDKEIGHGTVSRDSGFKTLNSTHAWHEGDTFSSSDFVVSDGRAEQTVTEPSGKKVTRVWKIEDNTFPQGQSPI